MDIKSLNLDELKTYITEKGYPAYRAKQIYEWLHKKCVRDVSEMTNLPADLKEEIGKDLISLEVADKFTSKVDGTVKFVFKLPDNNVIESVFMPYKHGNSVCVSSQAGCRMGCSFCASTLLGLSRNLTPSEILDQIYAITYTLKERVSNIVIMGTGEPLDNYDNVLKFIRLVSDENGLNISMRNITLSSCGIVPNIYRLSEENLPITFALSLHASNDEKRKKLMPIAHKYSIDETIKACKDYFDKTGRRVSFEYSLVAGENDSSEDAAELSKLLKGFPCHVNLIPVNPIKEREYKKSSKDAVSAFKVLLEKNGINVTIRRGMGKDIDAACGQLRKAYIEGGK